MPPEYHSRDELEAFAHVRGTALGPDNTLIVFVTAKRAESELDESDIVPKQVTVDGETHETDVIEVGIPHSENATESETGFETTIEEHRDQHRPLVGGVSMGNTQIGAGTLGYPYFRHAESGEVVALTNSHVSAKSYRHTQPSRMDGGDGETVATLMEESTLDPEETQTTDSALLRVDEENASNYILGIGPLVDFDEANYSYTYTKAGRTTGVTEGELVGTNARINVAYGSDTIRFVGCDVFTDMSGPGDSGSIIGYNDSDGEGLVGTDLLFAGSDRATIGISLISGVQEYHGDLEIPDQDEEEPDEGDGDETGNGNGSDDSSDDSSGDGSDDGSDSGGDEDEEDDIDDDPDEPEPPEEPEEPEEPDHDGNWKQFRHQSAPSRVVDGDTIDFTVNLGPQTLTEEHRIRLLEIDTAERGSEDFDEHTRFTQEWIETGVEDYSTEDDPADEDERWPFVLVTYQDKFDSFGRLLTRVVRKSDNSDLTEDLLEEYGETVRYDLDEQLQRLLR